MQADVDLWLGERAVNWDGIYLYSFLAISIIAIHSTPIG